MSRQTKPKQCSIKYVTKSKHRPDNHLISKCGEITCNYVQYKYIRKFHPQNVDSHVYWRLCSHILSFITFKRGERDNPSFSDPQLLSNTHLHTKCTYVCWIETWDTPVVKKVNYRSLITLIQSPSFFIFILLVMRLLDLQYILIRKTLSTFLLSKAPYFYTQINSC